MNEALWSAYNRTVTSLSAGTWSLRLQGAHYWSNEGPGELEDGMCAVLGLPESTDLAEYFSRLARVLGDRRPEVSVLELTRVLLATEIGISSVTLALLIRVSLRDDLLAVG